MADLVLTPPDGAHVVQTPAGRVWLREGIVHEAIDVEHLGLEELRGLYQGIVEVVGEIRPVPLIADLGNLRSASSEARAYAASPELQRLVEAHAFLVGSPVARLIVGFFVRVFHPPFPVRLFQHPSPALEWLRGRSAAAG